MLRHIICSYWKRHKVHLVVYWCALFICTLVLNIALGRLIASLHKSEAIRASNKRNPQTLYIANVSGLDLNDCDTLLNNLHISGLCESEWINFNFSDEVVDDNMLYYDEIDGNMVVEDGILGIIPISINGYKDSDLRLITGRLPENEKEFLSFGGASMSANYNYTYDPDNLPQSLSFRLPSIGNVNVVGILDNEYALAGLCTTLDCFKIVCEDQDDFKICMVNNDLPDNTLACKYRDIISEFATVHSIDIENDVIDENGLKLRIYNIIRDDVQDAIAVVFLISFILFGMAGYFYSELEYEYSVRIRLGCTKAIKYSVNLRLCLLLSLSAALLSLPVYLFFNRVFYSNYAALVSCVLSTVILNLVCVSIYTALRNHMGFEGYRA